VLPMRSAKGLEFPVVFIIASGNKFQLRRKDADDEEHASWLAEMRRMLYVAMTRAMSELVLVYPGYDPPPFEEQPAAAPAGVAPPPLPAPDVEEIELDDDELIIEPVIDRKPAAVELLTRKKPQPAPPLPGSPSAVPGSPASAVEDALADLKANRPPPPPPEPDRSGVADALADLKRSQAMLPPTLASGAPARRRRPTSKRMAPFRPGTVDLPGLSELARKHNGRWRRAGTRHCFRFKRRADAEAFQRLVDPDEIADVVTKGDALVFFETKQSYRLRRG